MGSWKEHRILETEVKVTEKGNPKGERKKQMEEVVAKKSEEVKKLRGRC